MKATIDNYLQATGKSKREMAAILQTSESNLYYKLRNEAFTLDEIRKIASWLGVELTSLLDSTPAATFQEPREHYKPASVENELLKSEIDLMKQMLVVLEKRVNML